MALPPGKRIRLGLEIRHVNRPSLEDATPAGRPADREPHPEAGANRAMVGNEQERVALETLDQRVIGCAEPHGAPDQRVEDRLERGRRAGDDPQNLGGRCLLLE